MITKTKGETDFIKMVARCLAEKFIEPLLLFSKEKNHSAGIGGLAEILDWAQEFYDQYYHKIINWESFKESSDNIYNADTPDHMIIMFGQERLKKFCTENANHENYFIEKYSAITSR